MISRCPLSVSADLQGARVRRRRHPPHRSRPPEPGAPADTAAYEPSQIFSLALRTRRAIHPSLLSANTQNGAQPRFPHFNASIPSKQDLKYLMAIAKSLGLQCLIEVHTEAEMERVLRLPGVEMLGINNRDLGTFKVDLNLTCRLLETAPGKKALADGVLVVGESGIFTFPDVQLMQSVGVGAVLVGESIVKQDDPETGVKKLYGKA